MPSRTSAIVFGPGSQHLTEQRAARSRLAWMLGLALAAHLLAFVVLRVGGVLREGFGPPGLEVRLVSDELPEARRNDTATYLSQRTQHGSGNTTERTAARTPGGAAAGGAPPAPDTVGTQGGTEEERLSTNHPRARVALVARPAADAPEPQDARLPLLLGDGEGTAQAPSLDADDTLTLRGRRRDELYVTPDTRASDLAPYLDSWRRRVERVGTLNYPTAAARRGLKGNPVIEVTLRQDGALQSAVIRRSSGHPEIDAAALQILRLASPYDPFPPSLNARYRVLHFAYEWQFVGGRLGSGNVTLP